MPQEAAKGPFPTSAGAAQDLSFPTRVKFRLELLESKKGVPKVSAVLNTVMSNEHARPGAGNVSVSNIV
jgi:hypothetical protein